MTTKVTFQSEVNGIQFDSVNATANHLLANRAKSDIVRPVKAGTKATKGGKAKVSIGADNEQEIS